MAFLMHSFLFLVVIFLAFVFVVLANVASSWTKKHIKDSRKTCLLKLRHGQYMGNGRKQLFLGRETYRSITCSICNSVKPHTSLHVFLNCRESRIHALRTERHNKAVWTVIVSRFVGSTRVSSARDCSNCTLMALESLFR